MRIHGSLAAMPRAAAGAGAGAAGGAEAAMGGAGAESPEGASSMESAKEDQGVLAIEDIAAKEGALVAMMGELLYHTDHPQPMGLRGGKKAARRMARDMEPRARWKSTLFGARLSRTKPCSGP